MGIAKFETPTGEIQSFEIAGDNPTEQEINEITNFLQSQSGSNSESNIDRLFNITKREVESDLSTDGITTNRRKAFDDDVDYSTGIKNQGFRLGFSNANTDAEKAAFLIENVGQKGKEWDVDKGGRFILTTEGRQVVGDPGQGKIAIDEEGLSWTDVTDFVGEAGLPILGSIVGTVGALWAAPVAVPLLAASVGAGLGAGLFSFFDEGQQKARGISREDFSEYGSRAGIEALLAGTGEYAGGVALRGLRRIIKGSGTGEKGVIKDVLAGQSSQTPEALKKAEELKALVDEGYTLDITGEGITDRPFLGVVVRLYETLMPGRIADNADVLAKRINDELFEGRKIVAVDKLEETIGEFEAGKLTIGQDFVDIAEKDIQGFLTNSYDNILAKVQEGNFDPAVAAEQLGNIQRAFHATMDDTFDAIDVDLGSINNKLSKITNPNIKKQLELSGIIPNTDPNLSKFPVGPSFIRADNFIAKLKNEISQGGVEKSEIKNTFIQNLLDGVPLSEGGIPGTLNLKQFNAIRSFINGYDAEKQLVKTGSKFELGKIKQALDDDLNLSSINVREINSSIKDGTFDFGKLSSNSPIRKSFEGAMKSMEESIDRLDQSQQIYKNFMEHQDDASIRSIVRSVMNGEGNPGSYVDNLLSNPTSMAKYFSALRKARSAKGLDTVKKDLKNPLLDEKGNNKPFGALGDAEVKTLQLFSKRLGQEPQQAIDSVKGKIQNGVALNSQEEIGIRNLIDKADERVKNYTLFDSSLNDTLPEIENKSIEVFQKKFLQNALKDSTEDGNLNLQKFTRIIDKYNTKPKSASRPLDEAGAPIGESSSLIDPAFENKSLFELIFPEGKGAELVDSVVQLNRNLTPDELKNFSFPVENLSISSLTPNTDGKDINELIGALKSASAEKAQIGSKVVQDMSDIAENQTGMQALRYINKQSPGTQAAYFRAADAHINKLIDAGDDAAAKEFIDFRNQVRDYTLAKLIDKASSKTDDVLNVLDPEKLKNVILNNKSGASSSGYSAGELDQIFGKTGSSVQADGTVRTIMGESIEPGEGSFTDLITRLADVAEKVSSTTKTGAKRRPVGLQAATMATNISQGLTGSNAPAGWRSASKFIRALTISRVIQSDYYIKKALNPPKSLADLKKYQQAMRELILQTFNQIVSGGAETGVDDAKQASRSLATSQEVAPQVEEVEIQEEVTERLPQIIKPPRRTIPTPQQISLDGPAQQMSANVERDIALGAAGNNPTMQALLRARGQG